DREDIDDLRDHLARYPDGKTARYALAKLDELVWVGLGSNPGVQNLRAYLEQFPKGIHAPAAQKQITTLEAEAENVRAMEQRQAIETSEWGAVAGSTIVSEIEAFLARWPNGKHTAAASERLRELKASHSTNLNGIVYVCLIILFVWMKWTPSSEFLTAAAFVL